jgi:hypothetical protein
MTVLKFLHDWEKNNYKVWIDMLNKNLDINFDTLSKDFKVVDNSIFWIDNIQKTLFNSTNTIFKEGLEKNILVYPLIDQLKYLLNQKLGVFRHNLLPFISTGYILTTVLINKKEYKLLRVAGKSMLPSNYAIFAIIPDSVEGNVVIIPNVDECEIIKYFFTHGYNTIELNGNIVISPKKTVPVFFVIGMYKNKKWQIEMVPFGIKNEEIRTVFLNSLIHARTRKTINLVEHNAKLLPLREILDISNPKISYCLNFISNIDNLKSWGHRSGWPDVLHLMNSISNKKGKPLMVVDTIEDLFSWRVLEQEKCKHKNVYYNSKSHMISWSDVKIKGSSHIARLPDSTIVIYNNGWTTEGTPTEEEFETLVSIKEQEISVPWIGFWHNPQEMPTWFDGCHSPEEILKRDFMKRSLKSCLGIITLSNHLGNWLKINIPKATKTTVPIYSLVHPTEIPELNFNFDKFLANPNKLLIQIGYWLRHRTAINHITGFKGDEEIYKRVWLYGAKHALDLLDEECEFEGTSADFEGVYIDRVDNDQYDRLFVNNIVFLKIFKSSANNAIIECMARNTPVIVNRDPAIVEYLGIDYPLFYDTLEEAQAMIFDFDLIKKAHNYMLSEKLLEKVKFEPFLTGFRDIINSL